MRAALLLLAAGLDGGRPRALLQERRAERSRVAPVGPDGKPQWVGLIPVPPPAPPPPGMPKDQRQEMKVVLETIERNAANAMAKAEEQVNAVNMKTNEMTAEAKKIGAQMQGAVDLAGAATRTTEKQLTAQKAANIRDFEEMKEQMDGLKNSKTLDKAQREADRSNNDAKSTNAKVEKLNAKGNTIAYKATLKGNDMKKKMIDLQDRVLDKGKRDVQAWVERTGEKDLSIKESTNEKAIEAKSEDKDAQKLEKKDKKVEKIVVMNDNKMVAKLERQEQKTDRINQKQHDAAVKEFDKKYKKDVKEWEKGMKNTNKANEKMAYADDKVVTKNVEETKEFVDQSMEPVEQDLTKVSRKLVSGEKELDKVKEEEVAQRAVTKEEKKELEAKELEDLNKVQEKGESYEGPSFDPGLQSVLTALFAPTVASSKSDLVKMEAAYRNQLGITMAHTEDTTNEELATIAQQRSDIKASRDLLAEKIKLGSKSVNRFADKLKRKGEAWLDDAAMQTELIDRSLGQYMYKLQAPTERQVDRERQDYPREQGVHMDKVSRDIVLAGEPAANELHDIAYDYLEELPRDTKGIVMGLNDWDAMARGVDKAAIKAQESAANFANILAQYGLRFESEAGREGLQATQLSAAATNAAESLAAQAGMDMQNTQALIMQAFQEVLENIDGNVRNLGDTVHSYGEEGHALAMEAQQRLDRQFGGLLKRIRGIQGGLPEPKTVFYDENMDVHDVMQKLPKILGPTTAQDVGMTQEEFDKWVIWQQDKASVKLRDLMQSGKNIFDRDTSALVARLQQAQEATMSKMQNVAARIQQLIKDNMARNEAGEQTAGGMLLDFEDRAAVLQEEVGRLAASTDGEVKQAALEYQAILKEATDAHHREIAALPDAAAHIQDRTIAGLSSISAKERENIQHVMRALNGFVQNSEGKYGDAEAKAQDAIAQVANALAMGKNNLGNVLTGLQGFDADMKARLTALVEEMHTGKSLTPEKAKLLMQQIAGSFGGAENVLRGLDAKMGMAEASQQDAMHSQEAQATEAMTDMEGQLRHGANDLMGRTRDVSGELGQHVQAFSGAVQHAAGEWSLLKKQMLEEMSDASAFETDLDQSAAQNNGQFRLSMSAVKKYRDKKLGSLVESMSHLFLSCFHAFDEIEKLLPQQEAHAIKLAEKRARVEDMAENSEAVKDLKRLQVVDQGILREKQMVLDIIRWAKAHATADSHFRKNVIWAFNESGIAFENDVEDLTVAMAELQRSLRADVAAEVAGDERQIGGAESREARTAASGSSAEQAQIDAAGQMVDAHQAAFHANADAQAKRDAARAAYLLEKGGENKNAAMTIEQRMAAELARASHIDGELNGIMKAQQSAVTDKTVAITKRLHDVANSAYQQGHDLNNHVGHGHGSLAQRNVPPPPSFAQVESALDADGVAQLRRSGMDERGVHELLEARHRQLVEQLAGVTHARSFQ